MDYLWTGPWVVDVHEALTSRFLWDRRALRSRVLLIGSAMGQHRRRGSMFRANGPPAITAGIRDEDTPSRGGGAWRGPSALPPNGCSSGIVVSRVLRAHPLKLHAPQ